MLKKINKEVLFGGIFGIIAIIAALGEMIANGFSIGTVLATVKDIAGTLVAVMVFIIAIKHLFVKKPTDFNGIFTAEMEKVISKYSPILIKSKDAIGRYNIASNLDSIVGKETGAYHTMFDIVSRKEITFHISKTVFMGKSKESFDELQQKISTQIGSKIKNSFEIVDSFEINSKGVKFNFVNELKTNDDAIQLAELVDCVVFLYFIEYRK